MTDCGNAKEIQAFKVWYSSGNVEVKEGLEMSEGNTNERTNGSVGEEKNAKGRFRLSRRLSLFR